MRDWPSRRTEVDGIWSLTPSHELTLTLRDAQGRRRRRVSLKGGIIAAEAHRLLFALRRHELDGQVSAQELELSGRWQADARNRLVFMARKGEGAEDRLTFQGGWEVGPRHELLYRYEQQLDPRRRTLRALRFAGAWDVAGPNRLVYRLDASGESAFAFRASLQTPSLNARRGRLAYQVGIELAGGRRVQRRIVLFGTWKLNRDLSVSLEIPYADGRRQPVRFQGRVAAGRRSAVEVELLTPQGKPLGVTVTFTRKLLRDAEWFVRFERSGREFEALAGVQVPF
ncbi:MAG: hypothetical protein HY601_03730 [Candidatus Omnitrophica bacterium]|nr:hypothetical protein [Candidatus Omnitrophota bacterium]